MSHMPTKQPEDTPSWYERQYVGSVLAICGLIATLLTGAMAWWMRDISSEARKIPMLEQRLNGLTEAKSAAESAIARLQLTMTAQDKTLALLEQRLGTIDASIRDVSVQLKQIAARLQGMRPMAADPP